MKKIRVSYANAYNAGDLMNKDIIELLAGRTVVRSKTYNADMTAIGGALIGLQYSGGLTRRIMLYGLGNLYSHRPVYIWGSGFFVNTNPGKLYRKNIRVCALRGNLSREKLETLTGKVYDVPLADAGLLADALLETAVGKKHHIGLVLHMSQKNDPEFKKMADSGLYYNIDITRPAKAVIQDIASCEYILSSSLHGLVFADALHIPSLHIVGTRPLRSGNFKFEDYYSAYALQDSTWNIHDGYPAEKDIAERCRIDYTEVDRKKQQLMECFPYRKTEKE